MPDPKLIDALLSTADDQHLSRGERRALRAVLDDHALSDDQRLALQRVLVDEVAARMDRAQDRALVQWLGDALALLAPRDTAHPPSTAVFGPGDPMVETLLQALSRARRRVDVAVFTITDDRLSSALVDLHRNGVVVRVLSDDDKAGDLGSDTLRLQDRGLAVRFDRSPYHFHHKFCVIDERVLVTGSYNWTRGADRDNRENFVITEEAALVARFSRAFEDLWRELA